MTVEVIIAVKDRAEIAQCVRSLLSLEQVLQIWICDAGSVQPDCVAALDELKQWDRVRLLKFPMTGFNKSRLLNQGILHTTSEYLLVSDADILWHSDTLQALLTKVSTQTPTICCVGNVQESDPMSVALKRDRYTYNCAVNQDVAVVDVIPWSENQGAYRPGCGLICARRTTLITLGGYKEIFTGWGWEDQDLLIRANLLGVQICTEGRVMHLSHSDKVRNQHYGDVDPVQTRNRNIITSLKFLSEGDFKGDLSIEKVIGLRPYIIQVRLPHSL